MVVKRKPGSGRNTRVIVFAESAASPGMKRLAKKIGAPDAALVYHRLLVRTLRHLAKGCIRALVAVPQNAQEFRALSLRERAAPIAQPGGSLGRRIATIARQSDGPCIVVDSDTPGLDATLVRHAASALGFYDLVLGPTWNGGYYLIGVRRPVYMYRLLRDVRWGSTHTLEDTLKHAGRHWKIGLLPVLAATQDRASLSEAAADHAPTRRRSSSLGVIAVRG